MSNKHLTDLSRRALIAGGSASFATLLMSSPLAARKRRRRAPKPAVPTCEVHPRLLTPNPQRAVSLRELCGALSSCGPDDSRCRELLFFKGITRLDGYVLDPDNHDIILWGAVEDDVPPLQFQDFAVALRSTHGRYAEIGKDGIRLIMQPAISIDPIPNIVRERQRSDLTKLSGRQKFTELCATDQTVRVEGMPRYTRVANVLVDADYRMKKVSQGLIPLASIPSSTLALWQATREATEKGRRIPKFNQARFWFEPGQFAYKVSGNDDTVFLDTAQVVLRDQVQSFAEGKIVDAARTNVDRFNRAFACAWTEQMEETYRAEPIWRDMHNIYRHFAIARIMADKRAFRQVEFDPELVLDRFDIPRTELPDAVPGLGRIESWEYGRSNRHGTYYVAVCGGVSVAFNNDLTSHGDDDGKVQVSGDRIAASRPTTTTLSWTVDTSAPVPRRTVVFAKSYKSEPEEDGPVTILRSIADVYREEREAGRY